jgi:hypothetical protein
VAGVARMSPRAVYWSCVALRMGARAIGAYTSLGEASARTQATDRHRRETPTIRTGFAGIRRSSMWLGSGDPQRGAPLHSTPRSAEARQEGVAAGRSPARAHQIRRPPMSPHRGPVAGSPPGALRRGGGGRAPGGSCRKRPPVGGRFFVGPRPRAGARRGRGGRVLWTLARVRVASSWGGAHRG